MNGLNLRRWRDLALGTALVLGVAACTWQGIQAQGSGLRRLYISGRAAHISDARIAALAAPYLSASLYNINLASLQQKLEAQPWLTDVTVSRHWPNGVVVHIAEHQPVALWGAHAVLAADGTVFTPPAATRPSGLIRLHGPDGSGFKVYHEYQDLAAILAGHGAAIAALDLNTRGAWTATLANGLKLRLGRADLAQRMRRFVTFALTRPAAKKALTTAGYVDLRYSNGFAVGGARAAHPAQTHQEQMDEQAA
jgi:cell division protein FtsQ